MNGQVLPIIWLLVVTVMALVNAIGLLVKAKKNNPGNYGERIKELETKVKYIERDIKEIKEKLDRK